MFDSKYSKMLTGILIVAIMAIIVILIFAGMNWYKTFNDEAETEEFLNQLNEYIANEKEENNNNIQNNVNNITSPTENNEVDIPPLINDETNPSPRPENRPNQKIPQYKGYGVLGEIEIPKTKIKLPVLEKVTPDSIKHSVAVMYGPGVNEIGNTVIVGHNFRNGKLFSNNKKLSIGDKIYLKDLKGKKVTYVISKKFIIDAHEFDYATRDTGGKRGISLSTCTDDSKNRLIIFAEEK